MLGHVGAFAVSLLLFGSAGCSSDQVSVTTDSGGTTTDPSSTGETTVDETSETTGSTLTGDTTTTNTTSPSGGFYAGPEPDYTWTNECDPFAQDCPDGEKCVPYASEGGTWDANRCVPVTGDGAPGDPCISGGRIDATDDCGEDSICWDFDDQNMGTCTEFCSGTADAPICPSATYCLIDFDGSVTICVPLCDPINQDCADGEGCYWDGMVFTCAPDAMGTPVGDPCGFVNDCAPGLACVVAAMAPGCASESCCTAFCDIDTPMSCADPNLECVPFFEQGEAPTGYANVGICVMPMP